MELWVYFFNTHTPPPSPPRRSGILRDDLHMPLVELQHLGTRQQKGSLSHTE